MRKKDLTLQHRHMSATPFQSFYDGPPQSLLSLPPPTPSLPPPTPEDVPWQMPTDGATVQLGDWYVVFIFFLFFLHDLLTLPIVCFVMLTTQSIPPANGQNGCWIGCK